MTDTLSPLTLSPLLEPASDHDLDPPMNNVKSTLAADLAVFLAPAQRPDEIGRLGGYRVLELLGEGGMGYVFLAEDASLLRPVALKVMKPEVLCEDNAKERFFREARAAARVKHDHVITIHQVGEDRGFPFLSLEYLEGYPLDKYLKTKGELPLQDAVRVTREIALGLQAAHRQGLIHRDIKPANIWLEAPDGRVKILDFGLARHLVEDSHLTKTGEVVGTPAFMSPEQARDQAIDHRSDLFSLGIILYRLCAGRQPFAGSTTMALLTSLAVDTPVMPSQLNRMIPIYLEQVILRLLEKEPSRRYQSAQELADALASIEQRLRLTDRPPESDADSELPAPPSLKKAVTQASIAKTAKDKTVRTANMTLRDTPTLSELPRRGHKRVILAASIFLVVGALVFFAFFKSRHQPIAQANAAIPAPAGETIAVKRRDKLPAHGDRPMIAKSPFDVRQARALQESWSHYLGEKVEVENSVGMTLALIPPGKFLMGAAENELMSAKRELPPHEVEISKPFYMGLTEVTQQQFERVMQKNPSKYRKEAGGGPNFPVEQVDWHDAGAFCDLLSKLPEEAAAGRAYRLPTEAEWEYACRAGSVTPYFPASRPLREYAWFQDNANGKTQPVRQLLPNAWGLYDMSGNVWEWCADYYEENYYSSAPAKDPTGPSNGIDHVMRGGCWTAPARTCRSAYRDGMFPSIRNETFGFRVCFTVE